MDGCMDDRLMAEDGCCSDEEWPVCGECGDSMVFFFQLNGSDLPVEIFNDQIPTTSLFQTFACDGGCAGEPFSPGHCLRLVDLASSCPAPLSVIAQAAKKASRPKTFP